MAALLQALVGAQASKPEEKPMIGPVADGNEYAKLLGSNTQQPSAKPSTSADNLMSKYMEQLVAPQQAQSLIQAQPQLLIQPQQQAQPPVFAQQQNFIPFAPPMAINNDKLKRGY